MTDNNITPDFCAAFAKMQPLLPTIPKSATNPHFKSKFAPHDALIGLTNKILAEHGFSVLQSFNDDAVVTSSTYIKDDKGEQTVTTSSVSNTLVTYLLHSSGGYIVSHMNIGAVDKMLNYGAFITYFRRYAHFAILGLVGDIDDDGAAVTTLEKEATPKQGTTQFNAYPPTTGRRQLL